MHSEAFAFVKQFATDKPVKVIEIGSRNINGSVRSLFPNAKWTGLDLHEGPDVDIVCNALNYDFDGGGVDVVISCECFEHTDEWKEIVAHAAKWLYPGGKFIVTCAGPGRAPHSHIDGCQLREGEYYGNILPVDLREALEEAGMNVIICTQVGNDTQAMAIYT